MNAQSPQDFDISSLSRWKRQKCTAVRTPGYRVRICVSETQTQSNDIRHWTRLAWQRHKRTSRIDHHSWNIPIGNPNASSHASPPGFKYSSTSLRIGQNTFTKILRLLAISCYADLACARDHYYHSCCLRKSDICKKRVRLMGVGRGYSCQITIKLMTSSLFPQTKEH